VGQLLGALTLALAVGALAPAAPAYAASPYYASPSGSGNACTSASPCPLITALGDAATDSGDAVTINLAAGTYSAIDPSAGSESSLKVNGAGSGASLLSGSSSLDAGTITLENLGLVNGSATNGGNLEIAGGIVTLMSTAVVGGHATGDGGGIAVTGGTATIEDSTISGNTASAGGGIYDDGGTVSVYGSTVANNAGGGIDVSVGTLDLGASLLGSNTGGDDCDGTINDEGYNYSDDGTCPPSAMGNNNEPSLDLGSLSANQLTIPISSSSAAYDVVPAGATLNSSTFCLGFDERGAARIEDGASDCNAGAYQYSGATITGLSSPALELGLTVTLSGSNFASVLSASLGSTPVAIMSQTGTSLALALPLSLAFGSQPITLASQYDSATVPFAAVANPSVATPMLPPGEHGVAYSQLVPISGGRAPYSFATSTGSLPKGLSLSAAGLISGTPTSTGGSAFGVTVTDANGISSGRETLSLTIALPVITIKSTTIVVKDGKVPVTLSCKFAPCKGTAHLSGTVTTVVDGKSKTATVTLASSSTYSLTAGTSAKVELVLTKKGRKTLAHVAHHHKHETLVASVDAGQAAASTVAVN
jgi:hypothetical protein